MRPANEETQKHSKMEVPVIITHLYRYEVFQRFAHFQSFNMEMPSVKEIINPLTAIVVCLIDRKDMIKGEIVTRRSNADLGLRYLVVMVRECQVDTAGVDIHILA